MTLLLRVGLAKKEGRPEAAFDLFDRESWALEAHAAHSTHAAATAGHRRSRLLRQFGDHGFGGHEKACDRRSVLQRGTNHLGRVDDALVDHVDIFLGLGVEAEGLRLVLEDLADDDRAFQTGVFRDLAHRGFQRLQHDVDAGLDVGVVVGDAADRLLGAQQRHAAARHDAFLHGRAGRVEGVLDAVLLFLDLDLGRTTDADHRDAAGELGQTLLQLLAVVVRGGFLDLRLDLRDAGFDVLLLARALDDRGVLLVDHHLAGAAEHVDGDAFELHAEFIGDQLTAGQDCDVFQHGLAAIAEARRLDGGNLQPAPQTVDHQRRQRLALDVLGDDQKRTAGLHHGFEHRQHRLQAGELLLVQQHVDVFQLGGHLFGVGDEVGRQVAAVELHALDDVDLGIERLVLLDRDDAFIADLLHRLRDHLADGGVAIGRDGADLGDLCGGGDRLGALLDVLDDGEDRDVNAALEVHRVHAGGDRLGALAHDRLRQHGRGGGAVAGGVVGLGGDFTQHLRAHVLELVLEFDLLGDGDAVLGDAGCAEALFDHDVAALGAERHAHRVGQDIH